MSWTDGGNGAAAIVDGTGVDNCTGDGYSTDDVDDADCWNVAASGNDPVAVVGDKSVVVVVVVVVGVNIGTHGGRGTSGTVGYTISGGMTKGQNRSSKGPHLTLHTVVCCSHEVDERNSFISR